MCQIPVALPRRAILNRLLVKHGSLVLFGARLSIRQLFESGVHWRFGVYYNVGLEPQSLSHITGFMLMLSC